jgi:chromate reductase
VRSIHVSVELCDHGRVSAPLKILLLSGSTRAGSTNTAALRTAAAVCPDGVTTIWYDGLVDLPAFVPGTDTERPHPAVAALRTALADADAVLVCTPEYAGTLPGSLKNLLDWTVETGELNEKPIAWLTVAYPGRGEGATATLRTVLQYVIADIVEPACVRVPVGRDAIGADGTVEDSDVRDKIGEVLRAIARHVVNRAPAE